MQKGSLENANMNSDVLQVVANAAKALKKANKEMDIDKVKIYFNLLLKQD